MIYHFISYPNIQLLFNSTVALIKTKKGDSGILLIKYHILFINISYSKTILIFRSYVCIYKKNCKMPLCELLSILNN